MSNVITIPNGVDVAKIQQLIDELTPKPNTERFLPTDGDAYWYNFWWDSVDKSGIEQYELFWIKDISAYEHFIDNNCHRTKEIAEQHADSFVARKTAEFEIEVYLASNPKLLATPEQITDNNCMKCIITYNYWLNTLVIASWNYSQPIGVKWSLASEAAASQFIDDRKDQLLAIVGK